MSCRSCEAAKERGLTIIDKAGNFISASGKIVQAFSQGKEVITNDEVTEYRLKKCASCEFASKNYTWCGLCGCYIKAKTRVTTESCPAGKWGPIVELTKDNK